MAKRKATIKKSVTKKMPKNLFYVAHPKIVDDLYSSNPSWAKPSLQAAVKHAEQILNREVTLRGEYLDPKDGICLIVKVIRVVRRKPMPVEVEKI